MAFQITKPSDASELTYFRQRIGAEGCEKILAVTVGLHGEYALEDEVCIDTTVQEKSVTFPTDDKQYFKVIEQSNKLAERFGVKQRRVFKKEIKDLKLQLRFRSHPKNKKKARKAQKRLKTIAGILVRELERKLPEKVLQQYNQRFEFYHRIVEQKRRDKNKIYSLHEPHIYCMSKGKPHKKYEFGTKVSITKGKDSQVILGAMAFDTNLHDSKTLEPALEQVERIAKHRPKVALCDRGYRGKSKVEGTRIITPKSPGKKATPAQKEKASERFRKRAGIEPIIGHLKTEHRLGRNFLKGFDGDRINLLTAAAAFNLRLWLREILFALFKFCFLGLNVYKYRPIVAERRKLYFRWLGLK